MADPTHFPGAGQGWQLLPPREDAPSIWQSIQSLQSVVSGNQQKINDVEVQMTRVLGDLNGKLSSLQTLIEGMGKALERKVDDREERTYRDWERDRYGRLERYPQEQRDIRTTSNVTLQTISQLVYVGIAVAALLVAILKP